MHTIDDLGVLKDAPDDYTSLASVNEAAILHSARKRFKEEDLYLVRRRLDGN